MHQINSPLKKKKKGKKKKINNFLVNAIIGISCVSTTLIASNIGHNHCHHDSSKISFDNKLEFEHEIREEIMKIDKEKQTDLLKRLEKNIEQSQDTLHSEAANYIKDYLIPLISFIAK